MTRDGQIVYSGDQEWELHEEFNEDGGSRWAECVRCGHVAVRPSQRDAHVCWFTQPAKVAALALWMVADYDADVIAQAVEKPWHFNEEAAEAGVR